MTSCPRDTDGLVLKWQMSLGSKETNMRKQALACSWCMSGLNRHEVSTVSFVDEVTCFKFDGQSVTVNTSLIDTMRLA